MPSVFIGVRVVAGGVAFGQAGKDKDVLPELSPGHLLMGTYTTPVGSRISARGQPLSALHATVPLVGQSGGLIS